MIVRIGINVELHLVVRVEGVVRHYQRWDVEPVAVPIVFLGIVPARRFRLFARKECI